MHPADKATSRASVPILPRAAIADGQSRLVDAVVSGAGMVFREESLRSPVALRQALLLPLRAVGTEEMATAETVTGRTQLLWRGLPICSHGNHSRLRVVVRRLLGRQEQAVRLR
jgi:hypothetical protein